MTVRKKSTEIVEAIKVKFGTAAWPDWLTGSVSVGGKTVEDGAYLVVDGENVEALAPDEFAERYDRVRKTRSDKKG